VLHAYNHRKSRLYGRYKKVKELTDDEESRRIPAEDELTSTIIGPMDFLQPSDVYLFWERVIVANEITSVNKEGSPENPPNFVKHDFWPRRGDTEPDLVIQLQWPNGIKRILLIEIKWRSGLSKENQLEQQWQKFLKKEEQAIATHIFISLRAHPQSELVSHRKNQCWPNSKLVTLTWASWKKELETCGRSDSFSTAFKNWAHFASDLLEKLDVTHFSGFLNMQPPEPHRTEREFIFFRSK
jgi:hypothetical protein